MTDHRIADLLGPVLEPYALEVEDVDVVTAGKRRVVRVVLDGDGPEGRGPLLDDIAEATQAISGVLDDQMGTQPYTLEVSSRGVSRPLTRPAHWRRNHDRLVAVTRTDGEQLTGRVLAADEQSVTLDVDGIETRLELALVAKALVQIEMNRRQNPDAEEED